MNGIHLEDLVLEDIHLLSIRKYDGFLTSPELNYNGSIFGNGGNFRSP
jgi:hypothetical protein